MPRPKKKKRRLRLSIVNEHLDEIAPIDDTPDEDRRCMMGRPRVYKKEYVRRAALLAMNGATDDEIAKELDVNVRTLWYWGKRYPDFYRALKRSKEVEDTRVQQAMYGRAAGADRLPGYDTTAGIFWLKARQRWQANDDKPIIQQLMINIDPSKLQTLTAEQLEVLEIAIRKALPKPNGSKLIEHEPAESTTDASEYEKILEGEDA